jgi:aromatic-L-amino-acid decarboxylase
MAPDQPAPEAVPDLDWDAKRAREFGERVLDLWVEFLERLPSLPVATGANEATVREAVALPIPDAPMADDELLAHLRSVTFDWATYCGHPRFMAYITGAGTVPGAAADLLASGLNMNLGGWRLSPAATEIELALIRWFGERFGLPASSGGLLVSGGAMATFTALKAMRDQRMGLEIRERGVAGRGPVAIYASSEVHVTTDRAADMLGLGTAAVRKVPVDDGWRMRVDALREAIGRDRAAGVLPLAVVATAGTVATGAIDPLDKIANVCAQENLWLHVDGAYGGPAAFSDKLRPLLSGIERADSIAFDPHKWMYTPQSGGCVLVRERRVLNESFDAPASYTHEDVERTGHGLDLSGLGPQFSRGFQALKIWVSLLAHGRQAYAARIAHDVELARYLAARAASHPAFEPAAPVTLSICCFRHVPPDLPASAPPAERAAYLNVLNERLMTEIQLDGRVYISNAVLGERFVLRACVVNFRTESGDMDAVLDVAAELGAKLDAELRPASLRG